MHPDSSLPAHMAWVCLQTSVRAHYLRLAPLAALAGVEDFHA
ncbi:hypothetical protein HNQ07_004342 [Deinococcus metalli]|uniref:Uncharacterized protein n=1 Tax=Deinococcus metalli TaxID=1141878 RepID=A0A7W8KIK7_9DEIO|nr:hypothetical protein [Deinococcus metalli]